LPAPKVALAWAAGAAAGSPFLPIAIAAAGHGSLYALDAATGRVVKLDADGRPVARWGGEGDDAGRFRFRPSHRCDDAGEVCAPEVGGAIAVDGAGRVYVADYGNHRVQAFDPTGRALAGWGREGGGPGEFRLPAGIAVDRAGHVYVTDAGNHRVQVFDGAGRFLAGWGGRGTAMGRLVHPGAIAVDGRGDVYVADAWQGRVQVFDPTGNLLAHWRLGRGAADAADPVAGLAADVGGALYAAGPANAVRKLDAAGQVVAWWGAGGAWDVALTRPVGIAVDADGALSIADRDAGRVLKVQQLLPVVD
jgi:DNA-binding beta-propeller fold protein YncE